ncbi:hypothetical protein ACFWN5_19085 [Streptomyces sp. NPDC058430]|uniref:hypothetical protein n=1 Tax=Streptomyces sp. NPDC058430 TaxID=3346495 RepID=UPI00365D0448
MSTAAYQPTGTFTATAHSVLCQDWVNTDNIIVSLPANNPQQTMSQPQAAAFCNPNNRFFAGAAEAFVITDTTADGKSGGKSDGTVQLQYLAQDPNSVKGWTLTPLTPPDDATGTPFAVVAFMQGETPHFVCVLDDNGYYHWWHGWQNSDLTFDGDLISWNINWDEYAVDFAGLSVSYYLPEQLGGSDPAALVYMICVVGNSPTVCTLAWDGSDWQTNETQLPPGDTLGPGVTLLPLNTADWVAVAAQGGSFQSYWMVGGNAYAYDYLPPSQTPPPITAPSYTCGMVWEGDDDFRPVYLDANGIPFLYDQVYGSMVLPVNTPGDIELAQAVTSITSGQPLTTVYFADEDENLSVLNQTGFYRNSADPSACTAQWAASIPIATGDSETQSEGVSALYPSYYPLDPPTLFTANAIGELRLHQLNTNSTTGSSSWLCHTPALNQTLSYETTNYRTQVTFTDSQNVPVAYYPLKLTAPLPTGVVLADGTLQIVGPEAGQGATVTTDAGGTVTLIIAASDFSPPTVVLTDPAAVTDPPSGLQGELEINPGGPVQAYLAGGPTGMQNAGVNANGTLNYLSPQYGTFNTNVTGQADLFPGCSGSTPVMSPQDAVTAVNNTMSVGVEKAGGTPGPRTCAGFIINCNGRVPGRPSYQEFATREELHAELAHHRQYLPGGFISDIKDFFTDVWEAIKKGVAKVDHFVADLEAGIVSFGILIKDKFIQLGDYIIEGIEDACNAVMAVFSAIEAYIKDVIDFLKACFDATNILATQKALAEGLEKTIQTGQQAVSNAITQIGPNSKLFHDLIDDLNSRITSAAHAIGPNASAASTPNWQNPGTQAQHTSPIQQTDSGGSPVSTADLTSSPHVHYLTSQTFAAANPPRTSSDSGTRTAPRPAAATATPGEGGTFSALIDDFVRRVGSRPAAADGDDDPLWDFCRSLAQPPISTYVIAFGNDLDKLAEWILGEIDPSAPASWTDINIQALLLKIVEDGLDSLLALLDAIVVAFLEVIQDALGTLLDVLQQDMGGLLAVPIQLVWDLFNLIAGTGDYSPVSLETALTLLAAVPANIVATIVNGGATSITWPPDFSDKPRPGVPSPEINPAGWAVYCAMAMISEFVAGIAFFAQDATESPWEMKGTAADKLYWDEVGKGIYGVGVVANTISYLLSFPLDDITTWPVIDWVAGAGIANATMIFWELAKWQEMNTFMSSGTQSDEEQQLMAFGLSLISVCLGLASLGVGVACSIEEEKEGHHWDANHIMSLISSIITPCSNIAAPFGTQFVQDKCDPWVKVVPCIADLISYGGGGLLNMLVNLGVGKEAAARTMAPGGRESVRVGAEHGTDGPVQDQAPHPPCDRAVSP